MILSLDLETFSTVPIKHGAHRYAEEAEILLVALAVDDDPVQVWDTSDPERRGSQLASLQHMIDVADTVQIHNSGFDRTVLRHCGVHIPVEKIEDTLVIALQHSLPGALGTLCDVLGVPQDKAKDKDGKKLIHLFTKPRPKNVKLRRATRETHPDEWQRFIEYARLDVVAMRHVSARLPRWNCVPHERHLWLLDQAVNDGGVSVDLELARSAIRAFDRASGTLADAASRLTDGAVTSTTQRQRLITFLADECGLEVSDMTKGNVAKLLGGDLDPIVRSLLENRKAAAATAPAKYGALLGAVSKDGRLRGTLQFCGAARTGRDAGRIFQPQNLPRPSTSAENIETGILAMKADCEDLLYDVGELCSNAIRGCLVASTGHKFVISDLSNIEGRVLAWAAQEEWKIDAFKAYDAGTGHDLYKITAGRILGKDPGEVTKLERQNQGKVPELSGGFGGSLGAYRKMGGEVFNAMSDEAVMVIVKAWRGGHRRVVAFWYDMERAMRKAIENPGDSFSVRDVATFDVVDDAFGMTWLRMRLPSGRYLCYPRPRIELETCPRCLGAGEVLFVHEGQEHRLCCPECGGTGTIGKGQITYEGVNQYTRQWTRLETYYGKIVENWVQSVARDVFFSGFSRAMAAGYKVVLRVHDELVCEVPDTPEYTVDKLSAMLATNPGWSAGLPLAAAGHECYRYSKED